MVSQFGSLGYTIMGKTAVLTVVQKTIIDTLHKEGKPQTFITKEAGCSQSAVSKHVNRKLSGRKKCGRKIKYHLGTILYSYIQIYMHLILILIYWDAAVYIKIYF